MNKKLVTFAAVLAVAIGASLLNNPKHNNMYAKEAANRAFSVDTTTCPVVGSTLPHTPEPLYTSSTEESTVVIYKHCKKCNTGVYSQRKDGQVRCTFCNEIE